MTLINTLVYGGNFCLITGDTMRVSNLFNGLIPLKLSNVDKKTHQISKNFIAAAGGSNYIFDQLIRDLVKEAPVTVKGVVDTLNKSTERLGNTKNDFVALQITGFDDEDGCIYGISVDEEFNVNVVCTEDKEIGGSIICPGDYENALERTGSLQSYVENENDILSVLQGFITYLMKFQFELIEEFPTEISREFCYHFLLRDGENIISMEQKIDI